MCWSTLVFLSSLFHSACFQHSSIWSLYQNFIPFYCWIDTALYLYTVFCLYIHLWMYTFGLFLPLALVNNNTAVNIGFRPCFQFLWVYIFMSRIVQSYGNYMFSLLKNRQASFHSSCTVLHSCKQCYEGSSLVLYRYYLFIYLTVPGLSCSRWDLQSSLEQAGLFTVACEIWFPDQGSNPNPWHWES